MGLAARVAGATAAFALIAGGGYVLGDINDSVPGFLTRAPMPAPAAPFPVAPGAVAGPPVSAGLGSLNAAAPVPVAASVEDLVADFVTDEDNVGPSVGVLFADAASGQGVAGHAATTGRVPASTAKLLTAAAALAGPGADVTLDTRVYLSGSSLFIVGGGDTLLAADKGDPTAVNGRAGLGDLADQVAFYLEGQGLDSVTMTVDDSLFSGPTVSPSWDRSTLNVGYVAPITALSVNGGRLTDGEYVPRHTDPSLAAGRDFSALLTKAGITTVGKVQRGVLPEGAEEIAVVKSAPLGELVGYFLTTSDNSLTEVIGRTVAIHAGLPASFDGSVAAVTTAISGLGIDTTGLKLADCSGLGDGSLITPKLLVDLMQIIVDPAHPELREVATTLPIAGLTGTLYQRFLVSEARGLVRAKTGSLNNVSALAGTLQTADGRQLVFAVMIDDFPDGGAWNARAAIDALVMRVAACGCS